MKIQTTKSLGTITLALLITGSIDSIRNLPATALFGSSLIFFFIFAAVMFLIPTALVSAQLASGAKEKSGIYHWVRTAFGDKFGFLAIWLLWINTLVWYPSILSFIAGTAVYMFDPALAQNKYYLISVILGVFWLLTLINLKGLNTSAKFASICAVVGMIIPMGLIIGLGITWLVSGNPIHLHFTAHNIIPQFSHADSWISLTAIMTSFLGIELAAVHIKQVDNPQRTFPRAIFISVIMILMTMLFGALSIAFVLPSNQINLVNGVMQAFTHFFQAYHLVWLIPVMTVMLLIGSLGGMINWIISPAKGLLQAAELGYLPKYLCYENENQVPSRLLILQAIVVSIACAVFLFMPSVNGSYWLLTDLSTQLYVVMYVLMFFAAIRLFKKKLVPSSGFKIPGGKLGFNFTCGLGVIACVITLVVGFIPPHEIHFGGFWHFELMFASGIALMIIPALLLISPLKFPRFAA